MGQREAQMKIRLPDELKRWVEAQAKANCRSQSAEIVFRLEEAKRQQEAA